MVTSWIYYALFLFMKMSNCGITATSAITAFPCTNPAYAKAVLVHYNGGAQYDVSALDYSPGGSYELLYNVSRIISGTTCGSSVCTFTDLMGVGISPTDDIAYGFVHGGNLDSAGLTAGAFVRFDATSMRFIAKVYYLSFFSLLSRFVIPLIECCQNVHSNNAAFDTVGRMILGPTNIGGLWKIDSPDTWTVMCRGRAATVLTCCLLWLAVALAGIQQSSVSPRFPHRLSSGHLQGALQKSRGGQRHRHFRGQPGQQRAPVLDGEFPEHDGLSPPLHRRRRVRAGVLGGPSITRCSSR
jgi:hypothetical protein